jgi:hypothetical protein
MFVTDGIGGETCHPGGRGRGSWLFAVRTLGYWVIVASDDNIHII